MGPHLGKMFLYSEERMANCYANHSIISVNMTFGSLSENVTLKNAHFNAKGV